VEHSEIVREGMAQGEARGEARGRMRTLRSNLAHVLRKRYGEAAADLVTLVEAQTDPEHLNRWFDAAVDAASLEEVRAAFTA